MERGYRCKSCNAKLKGSPANPSDEFFDLTIRRTDCWLAQSASTANRQRELLDKGPGGFSPEQEIISRVFCRASPSRRMDDADRGGCLPRDQQHRSPTCSRSSGGFSPPSFIARAMDLQTGRPSNGRWTRARSTGSQTTEGRRTRCAAVVTLLINNIAWCGSMKHDSSSF